MSYQLHGKTSKEGATKMTVNEIITEKIIKGLEDGNVPWQKPWHDFGTPKNLISNRMYTGINFFLLSLSDYENKYFLTEKQAKQLNGSVKLEERNKPFHVIYYGTAKSKRVDDAGKPYRFLKYYRVYNVEQCENLNHSRIEEVRKIEKLKFNPVDKAEEIYNGYIGKPELTFIENKAYYSPLTDKINMPKKENFKGVPQFYSTLFHEMIHSSGHEKRLARAEIVETNFFGNHDYSKEELTAELGAAFLCAHSGIDNTLENSTAYIKSWLKVLKSKENSKWVIEASAKAQKAVNYILGDISK